MNDVDYAATRKRELASLCQQQFGKSISIQKVLFDDMPVSEKASMTVFSCSDHTIYAIIESPEVLQLGDVKKIVKNTGFKLSHFVAPADNREYFEQHALRIFTSVYPARHDWTEEEKAANFLFVPYSPALVKISGVSGPIRRYNRFGQAWQTIYQPSQRLYVKDVS